MSNLRRIVLLVATLWVGSLWTVGYLVAPTLFATLADRVLAGTIAGSVFRVEAWLSLACAAAMLVLFRMPASRWRHGRAVGPMTASAIGQATGAATGQAVAPAARWSPTRLVIAMALCTLIGYFGLQPFMAAIREAGAGRELAGDARLYFGMLHGAASVIYLLQSLLGVMLILKLR